MLEHGGRLRQAARQHGIALPEWLDLSTGINPDTWMETKAVEFVKTGAEVYRRV